MELLLLALGVFGVAAIGGAMAGLFDKNERIRRLLRRARTIPIREVREGQVAKVVGRVRAAGEPLAAPLTGRRCVFWEIEITEWAGTQPRRIAHLRDQRDFILDDGTGRAVVKVERALYAVKADARWPSHDPADERRAELLERAAIPWQPGRQITYAEATIDVGEEVAASGRARWEPDPDPDPFVGSYREMPRRMALAAESGEVVVVSGSAKEPRSG